MALKPCKECGKEISTEAKTCPHCGKSAPTGTRTSPVAIGCLAILVLVIVGVIGSSSNNSSTPSLKDQVLAQLKLDYTWRIGGFDNVMIANFTVRNSSSARIKDIEITCTHYAPSGTRIDENVRTIYEVVPPKSTRHFNDFNMGLILAQVKSSACRISNLVIE